MGFLAQSAWIIRVFAALLVALSPGLAVAAATALGVTLDASAGCGNGRINVSLTTAGANREGWRATNVAGATLVQGEGQTGFTSGTYTGFFPQVFSPSQPAGTQVGSYAYVGGTPPDAANSAEFFVFYDCTSRQVLLSCFGPYGTCPQTAQQALAALAPKVPTQGPVALVLMALLVAGAGGRALSRRA